MLLYKKNAAFRPKIRISTYPNQPTDYFLKCRDELIDEMEALSDQELDTHDPYWAKEDTIWALTNQLIAPLEQYMNKPVDERLFSQKVKTQAEALRLRRMIERKQDNDETRH